MEMGVWEVAMGCGMARSVLLLGLGARVGIFRGWGCRLSVCLSRECVIGRWRACGRGKGIGGVGIY